MPFYQQTHDFTCGPASLMMVVSYFKPDLPLTKDTEIDIWREATLFETRGTCRFGLALSAWRRGVDVRTVCNVDDIVYRDRIVERYEDLDQRSLDQRFNDLRTKAREAGIEELRDQVTVDTIRDSLEKGEVPMIMCSTAMFLDEDIPHWIVVTGLEGDMVHVNNPLSDASETVGIERFKEHMGSRGNGAMISLFKKINKRKKR